MYTICETPLFTKYCLVYWTQEEYEEFKTFLALNPEAGDVEPNSGGIRKIRWTSGGRGKSDRRSHISPNCHPYMFHMTRGIQREESEGFVFSQHASLLRKLSTGTLPCSHRSSLTL